MATQSTRSCRSNSCPSSHALIITPQSVLIRSESLIRVESWHGHSNGVEITQPPTDIGTAVVAVCDDTCGNLIQLIEDKPDENHDDAR
jgi:hypothetical protein